MATGKESLEHDERQKDAGVMRGIDDQFDELPIDEFDVAVAKVPRIRQLAILLVGPSQAPRPCR